MEGFIQGIVGGIVPAVVLIVVYFMTLSGRLAKIETNICWLKKVLERCLPPSSDLFH